ncbi:MAG TPA: hypothetical protein DCY40_05205 [Actinobacteria bacterium]|nr:hypothetical protein [Actinomycetota bacterium]
MEPSAVLSAWSAGVAAGTALVTRWGIVGPGFTWMGLGVVLLLAVPAALAGGGVVGWVGCGLTVAALAASRVRLLAAGFAAAAAITLVLAGTGEGYPVLVVTGAIALGGITSEMLLGHWYLVDPRLPRSALRTLCLVGIAGSVIDPAAALLHGALPPASGEVIVPIGWAVLAITSVLLMAAVWAALGERGYPAVMAATGLSYLAVLTGIGAVVLARVLVFGESLG